jgi:lipopolysaccharide transport system ATP-binding protein
MSDIVIKFENISKQYRLGKIGTGTLSHDLKRWYTVNVCGKDDPYLKIGQENILSSHSTFSRNINYKSHESDYIWALRNIDLEVKQGSTLGIIGKNGAGKSTLLKILSRVAIPTTGRISVHGHIASLLEVGTGFHTELTGRENIYMNGAIMGMSKAEIKRKLDEIVDFAGIEKYLDTPVKRYSSGMIVRLGFAVAAHLEPEILIVDEVLAVGDLLFQRKCIEKMINISKEGKTILFVSHNLNAVKSLCNTGIIIENGEILLAKDNIEQVIEFYSSRDIETSVIKEIDLLSIKRKNTNSELQFSKIIFDNRPLKYGENIKFCLLLNSLICRTFNEIEFGVAINDNYNNCLIHIGNRFINKEFVHENDNTNYCFNIENSLKPGHYKMTLFLRSEDKILDWLINEVSFEISDGNPYGYLDTDQLKGVFFPRFTITTSMSQK